MESEWEKGMKIGTDVHARVLEGKRKKTQIRHITDYDLCKSAQLWNKHCQGMKFYNHCLNYLSTAQIITAYHLQKYAFHVAIYRSFPGGRSRYHTTLLLAEEYFPERL